MRDKSQRDVVGRMRVRMDGTQEVSSRAPANILQIVRSGGGDVSNTGDRIILHRNPFSGRIPSAKCKMSAGSRCSQAVNGSSAVV